MYLYECGKELLPDDIKRYENELGVTFPKEYVDFILEYNGGTPDETRAFDFIDSSTNSMNNTDIRNFFVFYENGEPTHDDIMHVNWLMKEEETIPEWLFAFCEDSGGNPVCMSMRDDDYGTIYFCDHEIEGDDGYYLMSRVADSFDEFISMLYVEG